MEQLKKFNARRKWKVILQSAPGLTSVQKGINTVLALGRFKHLTIKDKMKKAAPSQPTAEKTEHKIEDTTTKAETKTETPAER